MYETEIRDKLNVHNKKLYLTKNVRYDFSTILKKQINTTIKNSVNDIEAIIITTKGTNFEVKFDWFLNFSDQGLNVIYQLCKELKDLLFKWWTNWKN